MAVHSARLLVHTAHPWLTILVTPPPLPLPHHHTLHKRSATLPSATPSCILLLLLLPRLQLVQLHIQRGHLRQCLRPLQLQLQLADAAAVLLLLHRCVQAQLSRRDQQLSLLELQVQLQGMQVRLRALVWRLLGIALLLLLLLLL
jgi:hypothetical protein